MMIWFLPTSPVSSPDMASSILWPMIMQTLQWELRSLWMQCPGGVQYGDSISAIVNCIVSIPSPIPYTHTHTQCKFKSVILFMLLHYAVLLHFPPWQPAPVHQDNPYSLTLNSDILSSKQPLLSASLLGSSPLHASNSIFQTALLMFLFITRLVQITRAKIISFSSSVSLAWWT